MLLIEREFQQIQNIQNQEMDTRIKLLLDFEMIHNLIRVKRKQSCTSCNESVILFVTQILFVNAYKCFFTVNRYIFLFWTGGKILNFNFVSVNSWNIFKNNILGILHKIDFLCFENFVFFFLIFNFQTFFDVRWHFAPF
jgi:hypothetical protein